MSSDLKYLKLLPPFDAMAESIYECVDDYDKEKLREVRKFLHTTIHTDRVKITTTS